MELLLIVLFFMFFIIIDCFDKFLFVLLIVIFLLLIMDKIDNKGFIVKLRVVFKIFLGNFFMFIDSSLGENFYVCLFIISFW